MSIHVGFSTSSLVFRLWIDMLPKIWYYVIELIPPYIGSLILSAELFRVIRMGLGFNASGTGEVTGESLREVWLLGQVVILQ